MEVLAYLLVLSSLKFRTCATLSTGQVNDIQREPTPPLVTSLTHNDPSAQMAAAQAIVHARLHGPNICNSTIEYDGIVEETFKFTGKVRKPCKGDNVDIVTCVDGFYTTTETGIGVRNVTRRMEKTLTECCFLYKEVNGICVKDTRTLAVLISIPSVLVGVISITCGICCYCCCRRSKTQRKRYSKV